MVGVSRGYGWRLHRRGGIPSLPVSSDHLETIYVELPAQGPAALRPVQAFRRADGLFLIASRNDDPESEPWAFPAGSLVRCVERDLAGVSSLVAVEAVRSPAPRLHPVGGSKA